MKEKNMFLLFFLIFESFSQHRGWTVKGPNQKCADYHVDVTGKDTYTDCFEEAESGGWHYVAISYVMGSGFRCLLSSKEDCQSITHGADAIGWTLVVLWDYTASYDSLYEMEALLARCSAAPTPNPTTSIPTFRPTNFPTHILPPSGSPTTNTSQPTTAPTTFPSFTPTSPQPSFTPTISQPSISPTLAPTFSQPSSFPTPIPSTSHPTTTTTKNPTIRPTHMPTPLDFDVHGCVSLFPPSEYYLGDLCDNVAWILYDLKWCHGQTRPHDASNRYEGHIDSSAFRSDEFDTHPAVATAHQVWRGKSGNCNITSVTATNPQIYNDSLDSPSYDTQMSRLWAQQMACQTNHLAAGATDMVCSCFLGAQFEALWNFTKCMYVTNSSADIQDCDFSSTTTSLNTTSSTTTSSITNSSNTTSQIATTLNAKGSSENSDTFGEQEDNDETSTATILAIVGVSLGSLAFLISVTMCIHFTGTLKLPCFPRDSHDFGKRVKPDYNA